MSMSKIDRRTMMTMAGSAGLAGVLGATSSHAWADQTERAKEVPSPSNTVPKSSLQLEPRLQKELLSKLRSGEMRLSPTLAGEVKIEEVIRFVEAGGTRESPQELPSQGRSSLETLVRLIGRPVLFVQNGTFQTAALQLEELRQQLEGQRGKLEAAIPAVGRIELRDHPDYSWVGTAWLVAEDIAVTNRHVAELFASRAEGGEFRFKLGVGRRPIKVLVDFVEEYVPLPEEREFRVLKVLYIEPENGHDLALLKIARTSDFGQTLAKPIGLFEGVAQVGRPVAVIGYPAYDSRIPNTEAMQRIYSGIYDVKRLAPGVMIAADANEVQHDCSTLGGNSGSAVIDMETGRAMGLHWGGTYLTANYAVPASIIADRLAKHKS